MRIYRFRFFVRRVFIAAFSSIFLFSFFFSFARAVTSDANFTLTVGSVNFTVISGSAWNSFTVNTNGTLSLTIDSGQTFTLQSADKYQITHSFPSVNASQSCTSTYYELVVRGVAADSVTQTITPTTVVCATSGSSAGGSSTSGTTTTTTTTTKTVVQPVVVAPKPAEEPEPDAEIEPEDAEEVPMALPDPVTVAFRLNKVQPVLVAPGVSHEVVVFQAFANRAKLILQSEPLTLLLIKGLDVEVDTDGDLEKDLRLTYKGFDVNNNPQIEFQSLILVPAPEVAPKEEPSTLPLDEDVQPEDADDEPLLEKPRVDDESEKKLEEEVIEPKKPVVPAGFVKKEDLAPELSLDKLEERVVEIFKDIVDAAAQTQHWAAKAVAAVVQRNIMMGSDKEVSETMSDGTVVKKTVKQFDPNRNTLRCEMAAIALRFLGEAPDMSIKATSFEDVGGDLWCIPHIKRVAELGIMIGYDNSVGKKLFGPTNTVKRSEALKIILESAKVPVIDAADVPQVLFPDVESDVWYARYVATGVKIGLVKGYQDGNFRPGQDVTRGEMAALISRMLDYLASRQ